MIDQALVSATACVISVVLISIAPICAVESIERADAKTQWRSSMSQCVYDAHGQVIFGASSIDVLRLLAPAYNALALILFFSGVTYNVASKLWDRHKISTDEYVSLQSMETVTETDDTRNTHNTDETTHEDATDETFEETVPMLRINIHKAGMAADAWDRARERVCFIGVVLASQSYSFLLICIFAVFNDKWWIDV